MKLRFEVRHLKAKPPRNIQGGDCNLDISEVASQKRQELSPLRKKPEGTSEL